MSSHSYQHPPNFTNQLKANGVLDLCENFFLELAAFVPYDFNVGSILNDRSQAVQLSPRLSSTRRCIWRHSGNVLRAECGLNCGHVRKRINGLHPPSKAVAAQWPEHGLLINFLKQANACIRGTGTKRTLCHTIYV
ncbi:predicted protein [Histoplasma capsulatum var. duboisii H88]|uniref:Predicted protein n=1 Tax=Ajellomyces capsulatus (strain H88) TaxID=544711 RepID=F0UGD6_AJEC8|nr:predicted protein [Histoplasma capsulatum var. duboisii H88]